MPTATHRDAKVKKPGSLSSPASGHGTGGAKVVGRQIPFTEDELHTSVAETLKIVLAGQPVFWTTIEHGGFALNKWGQGRMSRHGIQAGTPDIVVVCRSRALFIELKTLTGTLSDVQKYTHAWIKRAGAEVVTCRSVEDVLAALSAFDVPMIRFSIHTTTGVMTYGNSPTDRGSEAQPT